MKKPKHHIALPESTLKRFNDDYKLHYFDLRKKQIINTLTGDYNSQENYYPEDVEQFLSRNIEKPIGDLRRYMNAFAKGNNEFRHRTIDAFAKFCAVQELRVPRTTATLVNQFNQYNTPEGLPFQVNNSWFSLQNSLNNDMVSARIDFWQSILQNHDVNICIVREDQATTSFLLPSHHWYIVGRRIYFIVSPYRAVVLLPKEENEKYYSSATDLDYFEITQNDLDSHIPRVLNQEILLGEMKIVGLKSQLEKVKAGFSEFLANELYNFSYHEIGFFRRIGVDFSKI